MNSWEQLGSWLGNFHRAINVLTVSGEFHIGRFLLAVQLIFNF